MTQLMVAFVPGEFDAKPGPWITELVIKVDNATGVDPANLAYPAHPDRRLGDLKAGDVLIHRSTEGINRYTCDHFRPMEGGPGANSKFTSVVDCLKYLRAKTVARIGVK